MIEYFDEPSQNQYPQIKLNLEYSQNKNLHIIIPTQAKSKFNPLLFFIGQNNHLAALSSLSTFGFTIAILPENQLSGTIQQQVKEVKSAFRFVLLHANQLKIDTNRYFIWGEKQGALLASLSVLTANLAEWNNEDPRVLPLRFKAGIAYGLTETEVLIKNVSHYKCAPLLIFNGTDDPATSLSQLQDFADQLMQLNHQVQIALLKNTINGTDAFYTPYMLTSLVKKLKNLL
ncbi:hypothetical protein ACWCL1_00615 [Ligilactobacillus sp. LYQ135]